MCYLLFMKLDAVNWIFRAVLIGGICAGDVRAEEIPLRETAQGTVFGTERFAVRFDAWTGWAGEVVCDGKTVVGAAPTAQAFDILQDAKWVTGGGTPVESRGVARVAPDTARNRMAAGAWEVDAYVQLFPEARMMRRWFDVTWRGEADTKIKAFWLQGGALKLAEAGGYFYPGHYPPRRTAAAELEPGRKTSTGRSPYPMVAETGGGWSAVWVTDELQAYSDRGGAGVQEEAGGIRVTQSFNMQGHMRPGAAQRVGDAWLWLQPNDAETALRRMGEWFARVGQVPPEGRPDWLKRVILYSFHPGGTIGSNCKDLGGFKAAEALLPHIAGLGCNALWLMPLEDRSIYWPRDYYKLQEGIGTPEDYKAFTAAARALGMRVWQDCVPHGGCNEFPRAKEHPEWLAQNEDGSTLYYWCFDFNWPTWIDYMRGVASFYTREYGLDGFRIDACGGSKIPNWNPAIPYARASHAQAQGGFAMQRALREEVRKIRPHGANLAEVGASVHGAVSDSTYDFDLCYNVLHDFRKAPPEVFVPRLRRWLHEQQCAEVPDLVRMRHVESHDSLRSTLWYGADAQRALVALISWIHGVPMVYHEMEDGHYEAYRRIFHVRRHVAELNAGDADYLGVEAPEGVFACLRAMPRPEDGGSVVLVNLSGTVVRGAVSVPQWEKRGTTWARDLMTGGKLAVRGGRMEVSLVPFGYTVLRLESRALPELEEGRNAERRTLNAGRRTKKAEWVGPLAIDAESGFGVAWRTGWRKEIALRMEVAERVTDAERSTLNTKGFVRYTQVDGGVEVRCSRGAALLIDLPEAERWFADTAEGRFESPFRVRHPAFDGQIGSIYRLPQGTAVLWDSRLHPFGLDAGHARVGAVCGGKGGVAFEFRPGGLPASVRLLDRVGDDHGLKVLIEWRGEEYGVTSGVDEVAFTVRTEAWRAPAAAGTGDPRLTAAGGGWVYENGHYRARVGRNGALTGLWRREGGAWRAVAGADGFYTDKGFAGGKTRYAQDNDVETSVRIERAGEALNMRFVGEMRGFYRFDKLGEPIRFYSAYTFGDGASFARTCAFNAAAPAGRDGAFLSLKTRIEGAERAAFSDAAGEFLAGGRGDGRVRYAETAKAADAARLPSAIRVEGTGGPVLRLTDVAWFGAKPANVFMHGGDLHLAWLDGANGESRPDEWRGVTMNVVCGEDAVAAMPGGGLPFVQKAAAAELLRDGGFDGGAGTGGGMRFVRSNRVLPPEGKRARPGWQLPDGAEIVEENGNRVARVDGDGAAYRLVRQGLAAGAFRPGTVWRLTARMKGAGVRRGDVGWKSACLRWGLSVDGRTEYRSASLPTGDWEWREVSVDVTVPERLGGISVEAGLNGNAGRVWIDDLRISEVK
jgi:hypothetical protein